MKPRVLDTRLLFLRLLRTLGIEVVCEVGAMDGRDTLRFRQSLRHAEIIALEPNPANFDRIRSAAKLAHANVELVPAAAADFDGEAPFHLVPAPPGADQTGRRGMSSLLQRSDPRFAGSSITAPVLRLDGLLGARVRNRRLALWIDSEGMALETLKGAAGVARSLQLLHVEVESQPCIGASQHLYPEVAALLREWGFEELATSQARNAIQFDAIYVRANLEARLRMKIAAWLLGLRLHHLCIENMAAWRTRLRRAAPLRHG